MVARVSAAGHRSLEVGAGNLNHVPCEAKSSACDAVESPQDLVQHSPFRNRIRDAYRTIGEIPDAAYDRIVSIAAFEHFCAVWPKNFCGRTISEIQSMESEFL